MTAPDPSALSALPAPTVELLAQNLASLQARLTAASEAAHRNPAATRLLPVTKSVRPEVVAALRKLGQTEFGENRLEGLTAKWRHFAELGLDARWHFIGHLQRNKARRVLEASDVIHSVDSLRLLETLVRLAPEVGRVPDLYLQVKIAAEDTKSGLAPEELPEAIHVARAAADAGVVRIAGLMVMAPLLDDRAAARAAARGVFDVTAELARTWPDLELGLSMGMTGDFEEAIAAGSTLVRVGSALFQGLAPEWRAGGR